MTIPIAIFGFGLVSFLLSLPAILLAFVITCYGLFVASTLVGAVGLFCMALGVFLKLASLLFRA